MCAACAMLRSGQGYTESGGQINHIRAVTNAKLPFLVSAHRREEASYYMSKSQDMWLKKDLPTLRLGTVVVRDPRRLAHIFGCTPEEALCFGLGGRIAIQVDYRMVIQQA